MNDRGRAEYKKHLADMEAKAYAPGAYVMLHHASRVNKRPHSDAGRIGKIVSREGDKMVVEFFCNDLAGSSTFCLIPFGHWGPVPDFCVEEYESREKRRGWRLSDKGLRIFQNMGWPTTEASIGEA